MKQENTPLISAVAPLVSLRASRNYQEIFKATLGSFKALLIGCFGCIPCAVWAGDWTVTPRLSLLETYTDNVRLVEDGKRGDFITTITPGLSVRGNGARLQTNVDYNLQRLEYGHESDFNATNHQLQSNASAIVVKDWLFFDTRAQMSQQTIDNRQFFVRDNRGPDDNRQDILSYEFTPSLRHAFGSWAELDASYSNVTMNQSGGTFVGGSSGDQEAYEFSLASGRRFTRMPVRIFAERREMTFETGRAAKIERYGAVGSYRLNRQFSLDVTGGRDNNSFATGQFGSQSGPYWTVGGTWTPSERTSLSGAWGKRFFGDTFNISGNHRYRRWRVNGSYNESVQTAVDFQRQLVLIPLLDAQGLPIFDPVTSSQIFVPQDTPSATDDVFVVKQANAALDYTLRRGSVGLSFFQFDRAFQAGGFNELTRGASFNINWRLNPRLSWMLNTYFRENVRSDAVDSQAGNGSTYGISPSLSYRFGPHTTALLRFEHTRNDGALGGIGGLARNFIENAFSASLVFNL